MEEKTTKGLKEQRERRKRINRMKTGIITSIFAWMLISIILCVVLLCRVISLQNQIDRLVSSGIVSGKVQQDENQSKGEMSTERNYRQTQNIRIRMQTVRLSSHWWQRMKATRHSREISLKYILPLMMDQVPIRQLFLIHWRSIM